MKKLWEERGIELLKRSLEPLPQELNEIDWKVNISEDGERVARHLSAFSNYSEGGFMVFGVSDQGKPVGLHGDACREIVKKIGNVARDGLEPAIAVDTATVQFKGASLLFVCSKRGRCQAGPSPRKNDLRRIHTICGANEKADKARNSPNNFKLHRPYIRNALGKRFDYGVGSSF